MTYGINYQVKMQMFFFIYRKINFRVWSLYSRIFRGFKMYNVYVNAKTNVFFSFT